MMHTMTPGAHWDTWLLYVLGNGDMIYLVLTGIQALFKSHIFLNLVNMVILLSFCWILCLSIPQGRISLVGSVRYLLFIAIVVRLLFSFSINVRLIDLVEPKNNKVISGIPFLLGAPIAFLSQVGYVLSKEFDTLYSAHADLPMALTLTGGGEAANAPYGVVAHLIQAGSRYRIQDPYLKQSLSYFFLDCLIPMIEQGEMRVYDLLMSSDIWNLLAKHAVNPAMMTVYYRDFPSGSVKTCSAAYRLLSQDLKQSQAQFIRDWGREVAIDDAVALFQVVLNYIARHNNYASTPGNYIQQSALLDILGHPLSHLMSVRTSGVFFPQQLSLHRVLESIENRSNISSTLFQSAFSYLYSGVQVLVYALFPMASLFLLFPGLRSTVLKSYAQLLVWFPVTFLLLAIMNDMIATWSSELLRPLWDQYGGMSLARKALVSERSAKMLTVGNWLMTLAPAFAWVFVRGTQSALQQVLNASRVERYSHGAGSSVDAGNITLDNPSENNVTAHNFNTVLRTDIGAIPTHSHEVSTHALSTEEPGGIPVRSDDASDLEAVTSTIATTDQRSQAQTLQRKVGMPEEPSAQAIVQSSDLMEASIAESGLCEDATSVDRADTVLDGCSVGAKSSVSQDMQVSHTANTTESSVQEVSETRKQKSVEDRVSQYSEQASSSTFGRLRHATKTTMPTEDYYTARCLDYDQETIGGVDDQ